MEHTSSSSDSNAATESRQLPADYMIDDHEIMVVDAKNKLTGPHLTLEILGSLDLTKQSLRMVARAPENPVKDHPRVSICRIINKSDEQDRNSAKTKHRRQLAGRMPRLKVLELNWAIAQHDLTHRMKQMKGFLRKGYRVEVLLAKKKGSRIATMDEAQALVQAVRNALAEIDGGQEWKDAEGSPLKVMKLYLQTRTTEKSMARAIAKSLLDS